MLGVRVVDGEGVSELEAEAEAEAELDADADDEELGDGVSEAEPVSEVLSDGVPVLVLDGVPVPDGV